MIIHETLIQSIFPIYLLLGLAFCLSFIMLGTPNYPSDNSKNTVLQVFTMIKGPQS